MGTGQNSRGSEGQGKKAEGQRPRAGFSTINPFQRRLQDDPDKNDDKSAPPDISEPTPAPDIKEPTPAPDVKNTIAPTPTEDFPMDLRTNPPTPTMLFPPSLQTAPPTKEGATSHPTYEPTEWPTTHSPSPRWKGVLMSPINTVRSEWDADDTIVTTVVILVLLIISCVYCVCCKRNKDTHDVSAWGAASGTPRSRAVNKGDYAYATIEDSDSDRPSSPRPSSPTLSPRAYPSDGRVVVHNPMAETSPLLSPPRNRDKLARREAREARDAGQSLPMRTARSAPVQMQILASESSRGGEHSDLDEDLNI